MNIIQLANPADGDEIDRIMAALSPFSASDRDCVKELWDDYTTKGAWSSYRFCTGKVEGTDRIAGFACYGKHALTESTYDLYWIAVDPGCQRTGIGSDLLAYVENQVLALGGSRLIVETSSTPAYAAARNFYRGHHYRKEGVIHDFYGPDDNLVIYTKRLAAHQPIPPQGRDQAERNLHSGIKFRWGNKKYFFP